MKLQNINEFIIESKLSNGDEQEKFTKELHKFLDKIKLKYHLDKYNTVNNSKSYVITDINWENANQIGNHPNNNRDYTSYAKKGSIGSNQLEQLAKKLRTMQRSYKADIGLYMDGSKWVVYIKNINESIIEQYISDDELHRHISGVLNDLATVLKKVKKPEKYYEKYPKSAKQFIENAQKVIKVLEKMK